MDLGGSNTIVGPERYVGRYVNTEVGFAAWTDLTSVSFNNSAVGTTTPLSASLQFLSLVIYNLGATPLYLLLAAGTTAAPASSGLLVPPSANEPTKITIQAGAILPTQTPSDPTGIRTISIRGDVIESLKASVIILATFAGNYGP